ncbi:MAG: phage holin family protein [Pseudonocardiaceae bacterium]
MSPVTSRQPRSNGRHAKPDPPSGVRSLPLSPDPYRPHAEASLGDLVREAATHFSTLFRAEVELAKAEVTAEVRKGVKGSIFFVIALAILIFSLFFLFIAVGEVLDIWLARWAAFSIVFGLMAATATVFALLGWRRVRSIRKPQRTISSVRDTGAALARRRAHRAGEDQPSADPLRE